MQYNVTIVGGEEVVKRLNGIASEIGVGTEEVLDRTADQVVGMLVDKAPVFTGRLKDSVGIQESGPKYRIIGPDADYAIHVEQGGGPGGFPNVTDLEDRIFYGGKRGAWAFAKYLKSTGKAVRSPSYFIKQVADATEGLFMTQINNLVRMAVR